MSTRQQRTKRARDREPFIRRVLSGAEDPDAVDDYIDEWHEGDVDLPLYEFLGMTKKEYRVFGADARTLSAILYARVHGVPLERAVQRLRAHRVAARSEGEHDQEDLVQFLRDEGLLDE